LKLTGPAECVAAELAFPKAEIIGVDSAVAVRIALGLGGASDSPYAALPTEEIGAVGVAVTIEVRADDLRIND
jgi:hypothetical protein